MAVLVCAGCGRETGSVAPAPPEPVEPQVAVPAAAPVAASQPQAQADEAAAPEDSLKAALLGLGGEEPAQAEPAPPQRRRRRPRRPVRRAVVQEPLEPPAPPPVPDLSDSEFQAAVSSWRGMRNCLSGSSLRGSDRNGAMRVEFKIRGDGSVSECEVVETSNTVAATIAPCVERAARRIRFRAFGGKLVEKQAKFVF